MAVLTSVMAGVSGACVGSFVATAAIRATRGQQFLIGRSACDACGAPLGFGATVPVYAYVARRGTCSGCGASIDPLHIAGEVAGAAVAAAAVTLLRPEAAALTVLLGFVLLASSVVDAKTKRLPDALTLTTAMLCAALAALHGPERLVAGAFAAAATFIVLEGVRRGFLRLRKQAGLGFGDVKLLSACALWLGAGTPWAIVGAAVLGLAAHAALKPQDGKLPFGPMIAASVWSLGIILEAGVWRV